MTGARPRVTVIVPTYDEAATIEQIAASVTRRGYSLLVVDDGSPDGTGEIAQRLAATNPLVSVLHRTSKDGLGPAYGAGYDLVLEGDTDIICQMDADFSHDPDSLPDLVAAIEQGADAVLGSRLVPGGKIVNWPWHRRMLSRWGNGYARIALGLRPRDVTSGFRAYRRDTAKVLDPASCRSNGYVFQIEMTARAQRAGARIVEVPITFVERREGTSKLSGAIVVEAMWLVTVWGLRRLFRRR